MWNEQKTEQWTKDVGLWINAAATEDNPEGLTWMYNTLRSRLENLGFSIESYVDEDAPYRPVIVAIRQPSNPGGPFLGFFQHYDVEPIHEKWDTDPWTMSISNGRVIGRGIADNIGPLAHRLIHLENLDTEIGIVMVIQGEEEIGSPWAHQLFASLELPSVELWLDETGYFYKDGRQRFLRVGESPLLDEIEHRIVEYNQKLGIITKVRNRYLTKAFGLENCPCIAHLLGDKPYLAIGPNDDWTRVHGPNESISIELLSICSAHLDIIFDIISEVKS